MTILGGGIAGLALGCLVADRGIQADVYEARRAPGAGAEKGAGVINLALSQRGLQTLERLGLERALRPLMVPMYGRMIHANGGGGFQSYDLLASRAIHAIRRADLLAVLARRTDATPRLRVTYETSISAVDLKARQVRLRDRDGQLRTIDFHTLIGADGSGSRVRESIVAARQGTCRKALLDHEYKELTIPAAAARAAGLERHALHVWPAHGFMLIALPNPDGSFTATLFLPRSGEVSFAELHDGPSADRFFRRAFPWARSLFPDLGRELPARPVGRIPTVDCEYWHLGGDAVILGDAAHAMAPFFGQGMNCALEDCRLLDAHLAEAADDPAEAFPRFTRDRRPGAQAIAELSRRNYEEMRSSAARPDYALRRALEAELQRRHPERYLPLYAMVTFTDLPYQLALQRDALQQALLDDLVAGARTLDNIDLARARALVADRLPPLPHHCMADAPGPDDPAPSQSHPTMERKHA